MQVLFSSFVFPLLICFIRSFNLPRQLLTVHYTPVPINPGRNSDSCGNSAIQISTISNTPKNGMVAFAILVNATPEIFASV